jgi:hypothetical protein
MLPCVDGSTCFILDHWMNTIDCGNGHTVGFILNDCLYYFIIYILYLYDWLYISVHGFMEDTINWLNWLIWYKVHVNKNHKYFNVALHSINFVCLLHTKLHKMNIQWRENICPLACFISETIWWIFNIRVKGPHYKLLVEFNFTLYELM